MSKSFCFKTLGMLYCLLIGLNSSAFEVDGINYSTKSTGAVVAVGTYSGDVVIPETVTYDSTTYNVVGIANMAFRNCAQLTSVVIPETVTSIGQYAFYGCTALASVNIPSGVTAINARTFYNCNSLASLDIPAGVTSIGSLAFCGCELLASLHIPAAVASIGESAFEGCNALKTVTVDPANEYYRTVNGVLFNADCTELVLYPAAMGGKQYNVPATTVSIAPQAFYYASALQDLYIPGTVKNVGEEAFRYSSIKSVVFDEGVEHIGANALANDMYLKTLYLPASLVSIETGAFSETNRLSEVICPADSAVTIASDVFRSVVRARSMKPKLYVPLGAEANYTAAGWTGFTYTHPAELDLTAEYRVDSLIYVPLDSAYNLKISRVYTKTLHDAGIPAKLVINGNLCTVNQVAASAFAYCDNIISVNIPATVVRLFDQAFYKCASLAEVVLNEGLTQVGNNAFASCDRLSAVSIPSTVTSIANKSFGKCQSLARIDVDEDNAKYASIDGVLFSKDLKKLMTYPMAHGDTYEVPEGTASIETNAFLSAAVVDVLLPATLQTINSMAFSDAGRLRAIVIPDSVTKLNTSAFANCVSLESVELPSAMATLANDVFKGDTSLVTIVSHAPVPPACTASSFTAGQKSSATVTVPDKCGEAYLADPMWGVFENIVEQEPDVLLGDVNGDGNVNMADLSCLVDYLLNPVADINAANADCNLDGIITPADVSFLTDLLLNGDAAIDQ